MNFNTIKQELYKKIKKMSEEDFMRFIAKLEDIYYKNKDKKGHEDAKGEKLACYTCVYAPYAPACNNCLFDSNYIRRVDKQ